MSRSQLPPPDASGTDPDSALRARFSLGQPPAPPAAPVPGPFTGAELPGQPAASHLAQQAASRRARSSTRPDPKGMRRTSLYISEEAAKALEDAVRQVQAGLDRDVPKHQVLSALVFAAAGSVDDVLAHLSADRASVLADRLRALQADAPSDD